MSEDLLHQILNHLKEITKSLEEHQSKKFSFVDVIIFELITLILLFLICLNLFIILRSSRQRNLQQSQNEEDIEAGDAVDAAPLL